MKMKRNSNQIFIIIFATMTLFVLCCCSKKEPSEQIGSSDTSNTKEEVLTSMQTSIEEFNKLTPEELKAREKELKKQNSDTRKAALDALIARITKINKGVVSQEVEKAFKSKGEHQFTVKKYGKTYSCFSYLAGQEYWSKRAAEYYCIYEDDKLYSIIIPPEFEYDRIPYRGATSEVKKPLDPDKRINNSFSAANLINDGLIESLKKRFPKKSSSSNLGPLVGVMQLLSGQAKKEKEKDDFKRAKLEQKYDSTKIKIGMSLSEVNQILREPKYIHKKEEKSICVYGEKATFTYYPYNFSWIAVEFDSERVARVLRRDLFDERLLH